MLEKANKLLDILSQDINHSGRDYSPLALAYIGDAVYEIIIRTVVINIGNAPVNRYHQETKNFVQARSQAEFYNYIQEILTEKEEEVFKRGRNAKSNSSAKNADIITYRFATGLETLIGYLYVNNETDRIIEIMKYGLESIKKGDKENGDKL